MPGQTARLFSLVTRQFHTPMPALILQCIISVIMSWVGGLDALIHFFSFVAWMFYGLTTLGNVLCHSSWVGCLDALIHFFPFVAWMLYGLTTLGNVLCQS